MQFKLSIYLNNNGGNDLRGSVSLGRWLLYGFND